jgi:transposase
MAIVGGFDVHRAQITFNYIDTETGEVTTSQIQPADRCSMRAWLGRFAGRRDVAFAVEGCTGWRFVIEEMRRAGVEPHLAEPADTATQRGLKKRAKTDRADARLLRDLLTQKRLPESWIPPDHVLEVRTLGRLYVTLMDERRAWQQRIHAQLFHQGVPAAHKLLTPGGRAALAMAKLSPVGRQVVDTAMAAITALNSQIVPLRAQLHTIGLHQSAVRALAKQYGMDCCPGPSSGPSLGAVLSLL